LNVLIFLEGFSLVDKQFLLSIYDTNESIDFVHGKSKKKLLKFWIPGRILSSIPQTNFWLQTLLRYKKYYFWENWRSDKILTILGRACKFHRLALIHIFGSFFLKVLNILFFDRFCSDLSWFSIPIIFFKDFGWSLQISYTNVWLLYTIMVLNLLFLNFLFTLKVLHIHFLLPMNEVNMKY
jgi:hypothetical protein